ncbi:hypothetical protein KC19_10G001600 [Ceratodon purpureus]|uniref:Uncharacterized protein n=1 Tax=Ceratodon purpureus TaxID=3225 RepID=A0A8T0GIS4_CERPU|nr:hypothetical protein KC19_10G001600 [Ceratodon purpureus]
MVPTIGIRFSMPLRLRFVFSSLYGRPRACCKLLLFQHNCNSILEAKYL